MPARSFVIVPGNFNRKTWHLTTEIFSPTIGEIYEQEPSHFSNEFLYDDVHQAGGILRFVQGEPIV